MAFQYQSQLFSLSFVEPVRIGNKTIYSRDGFRILHELGIGECTPLPGLHKETLGDCLRQWESVQSQWGEVSFLKDKIKLDQPGFGLVDERLLQGLYPSLAFALEQVL